MEDYTRLTIDEEPTPEPEIVVAEAAPPQRDYSRGVPLGDNPSTLVPGGAATKPAAETAQPRDYSKGVPLGDNPSYTVQPQKATTGFLPNLAAGTAEGLTPGFAGALASPVDIPVHIARELYGSGQRKFTDLYSAKTKEEYEAKLKELDEANPIPESPGAKFLIRNFKPSFLPTPDDPITWVKPADRSEEKARRTGQVVGQVFANIFGSKLLKPIIPYRPAVPATVAEPGAATKLLSALTIPPRMFAAAPPMTSAAIAGGANYLGQTVGDQAREAGYSPETAHALEAATEFGSNLVGGGVAAGASVGANAARNKYFPNFPSYTDEFLAGTYPIPGGYAALAAKDRLAGRQLALSATSPLATKGNWDPSTADAGATLRGQLTQEEANALAQQQVEQAAARGELGRVGGTVGNLDTRIANSEAALTPHVESMQGSPIDLGKQLRASIGPGQRRRGVINEILEVDDKGNFVVPHSDVPGKVFNPKMKEEDLNDLMYRARGPFRQALHDAVIANFEEAAAARDAAGVRTGGIDLANAEKWLNSNKKLLEAYERQSANLWGRVDPIRDRINVAMSHQKMLNNLNAERDLMLGAYQTGGRSAQAAATAAAKDSQIWQPGRDGGQSVRDYLGAHGSSPEAVENVVHLASSSLRNAAVNRNGVGELDPVAARNWLLSHTDALSQLPPAVRAQFENATLAQELVNRNAATRTQALDQFRTGAARGYLNGQSPRQAIETIMSNNTQDPAVAMRELSNRLAHDPAAHDALKRDFMQYAVDVAKAEATSQSTQPTIFGIPLPHSSSPASIRSNSHRFMDSMNKFLERNEATVRELYGDEAADGMMKLINDHPGLRKPGAIATGAQTIGGMLLAFDMYAPQLVSHLHLPHGAQTAVAGALALNMFRRIVASHGVKEANDLLPKAMTNPALMRALLESAKQPGAYQKVIRQLTSVGTAEDMGEYGMGAKPDYRSDTRTGDLSGKSPMRMTVPGLVY